MPQKDYYQILHIASNATAEEIKAAYRKLAFKYHPDKNAGNTITEAVFKEINEAYSILSNPAKREQYHNNRTSTSNHSVRTQKTHAVTCFTLMQEAAKTKALVDKTNIFTIDRDALFIKVEALLNDYKIGMLLLENNKHLLLQYLALIIAAAEPLSFKHLHHLKHKLQKLANGDRSMLQSIDVFYKEKKQEALWQQYKLFAVLSFTFILCLLMFLMFG